MKIIRVIGDKKEGNHYQRAVELARQVNRETEEKARKEEIEEKLGKRKPEAEQEKPEERTKPLIELADPKNYIILEGKKHGNYEYPDMLVSKYKLGLSKEVEKAGKQLDLNLENTAKEKNGHSYIGNINWEQALMLNLSLGGFTLSPRQFIDFRELLLSGKIFDGKGSKISKIELDAIIDEIFTMRGPWRSEWLDADFKILDEYGNIVDAGKGELWLLSNHIPKNGILTPTYKANIEGKYLNSDSKINANSFNEFGLATQEGNDFYQWYPRKDNNSVERFSANSNKAGLVCDRGPGNSYSSLGVRVARKK